MPHFSVDPSLYQRFPGLAIGVVVGHDLQPAADAAEIERLLTAAEERLRQMWGGRRAQSHPRIAPWRQAFGELGLAGSRYHSSIEALARRVLSKNDLPRILPLVDLYNAVSLTHLIPMGGHALETLKGDIRLGPTSGGEPFRPMFSSQVEQVEAGEIAYMDQREVLTRHWVWRQCHKDRITPTTRSVFIPIDGLPQVGVEVVQAAAEEMAERLHDLFAAEVRLGYASAEDPVVELP